MFVTVLTQLGVNRALGTLGWARLLSLGLVLLGAPAPVQALSPLASQPSGSGQAGERSCNPYGLLCH